MALTGPPLLPSPPFLCVAQTTPGTLHQDLQCHLCFSVMNNTTRHLQKAEPWLNSSAMSQCKTGYTRGWHCITLPGAWGTPPEYLLSSSLHHTHFPLCWLGCLAAALWLNRVEKLLYLLLYTFQNTPLWTTVPTSLSLLLGNHSPVRPTVFLCIGNKLEELCVMFPVQ